MLLSLLLTLALALQAGMAKALHPWIRPNRWRTLNWILVLLNLPMFVYIVLRYLGVPTGPIIVIRPLARAGVYLQVVALLVILWSGLTRLLWWARARATRPEEPESPARRAFLRKSAFIGVGGGVATAALGAREAYGDPDVTRLRLAFPDLPAGLDGLRLIFLSDLHAGPLVGTASLRRWRELAEAERPDLLLIGGDFVESEPGQLPPLLDAFAGFRPALGTFAVLGNHDYLVDPRPIWRDLEAAGIRCLENTHALVERNGAKLAVVGIQDQMAGNGAFRRVRFGPGPKPELATAGLGADAFRLCLSHRPSMLKWALRTEARLILSGHTHGGQINPIPGVSMARLLGPYTAGLFEVGERAKLYVGRGLGVVGLPLRIQAPPEIVVITLAKN